MYSPRIVELKLIAWSNENHQKNQDSLKLVMFVYHSRNLDFKITAMKITRLMLDRDKV